MSTPGNFIDEAGVTRLRAKSPGGGSSPVVAVYSGDPVSIANNATAGLPWTTLVSGTDLLDRTDPLLPILLQGGLYILSITAQPSHLSAAGKYVCLLGAPVSLFIPGFLVDGYGPTGTATTKAATGDSFGILAENKDGSSSQDFAIASAVLVKLA